MAASMAVPPSRMTSAPIFEHTSESEATAPFKPERFWFDESEQSDDCVNITVTTATITKVTNWNLVNLMVPF
jgi:hypothetical protein